MTDDERLVQRQAFAGLIWCKQFYHYDVARVARRRPGQPAAAGRAADTAATRDWRAAQQRRRHLDARHLGVPVVRGLGPRLPLRPAGAQIDPEFAKDQLLLLTREWYMHPNGQLPAYEWAFGDVNPPVHAWAALARLQDRRAGSAAAPTATSSSGSSTSCCSTSPGGSTARTPTATTSSRAASSGSTTSASSTAARRCRSAGHLGQADGTAWMGMYCLNMLAIALELAARRTASTRTSRPSSSSTSCTSPAALNDVGGTTAIPLWDDEDEFFYDVAAPRRRRRACRSGSARWSGSSRCWPSRRSSRDLLERAARLPAPAALVPAPTGRTWPASSRAGRSRASASGGCWRSSAATGMKRLLAPDARPGRVPLATTASARSAATTATIRSCSSSAARRARVDYEPAESTDGALRRQLELARPGLVPDQLPADRGAPEVPPLLRRRLHASSARPAPGRTGRWPSVADDLVAPAREPLPARDADGRRPVFGADEPLPGRPALGATASCSTSTSTATPAPASGRATRPAGPRSSRSCSSRRATARCWPPEGDR